MIQSKKQQGGGQKAEEIKQAVIIDVVIASMRLLSGKPLLQFTLEWLELERFDDVFVCCQPHNVKEIKKLIQEKFPNEKFPNRTMNISIFSSEKNQSLGDCLRELDHKGVIKSDFIVMNVGCLANLNLSEILQKHKELRKIDKNSILTYITRPVLTRQLVNITRRPIFVCESKTGRLIHFEIFDHRDTNVDVERVDRKKSIAIETRLFHQNSCVKIYSNLVDMNMAICSPNVPLLFSDNFDYRTQDDLIRGIFDNEEVLGNSVYVHVIRDHFSQRVADPLGCMSQLPDQIDTNFALYRNKSFNTLRQVSSDSLICCGQVGNEKDLEMNNEKLYLCESDLEESGGESGDENDNYDDEIIDGDDDGRFYAEVLDSLVGGFDENTKSENLILEINASKHAYNISMRDVYASLIRALLELPHQQREQQEPSNPLQYFSLLTKAFKKFHIVLLHYINKDYSRHILLKTLEDFYISNSQYLNDTVLAKLIYNLYELDVLDEKSIVEWYQNKKSGPQESSENISDGNEDDDVDEDERISRAQLRERPGIKKLVETLEAQTDSEDE